MDLNHSFEEAYSFLASLPNSVTPTIQISTGKYPFTAQATRTKKKENCIFFWPPGSRVLAQEWGDSRNKYNVRIAGFCGNLDMWLSKHTNTSDVSYKYVVITENDESSWNDETGKKYHFPRRYLSLLEPGTIVIYYKGRVKDRKYSGDRLSDLPHYFGTAVVREIVDDKFSTKADSYALLHRFRLFSEPVLAKHSNKYLEVIPASKANNYWRSAVREVDVQTYLRITERQEDSSDLKKSELTVEDLDDPLISFHTEGAKKLVFSTRYERKRENRDIALRIHGCLCKVCGFDFEKKYGDIGRGYIHVHHIKPLSETGETAINPETDSARNWPNGARKSRLNKNLFSRKANAEWLQGKTEQNLPGRHPRCLLF